MAGEPPQQMPTYWYSYATNATGQYVNAVEWQQQQMPTPGWVQAAEYRNAVEWQQQQYAQQLAQAQQAWNQPGAWVEAPPGYPHGEWRHEDGRYQYFPRSHHEQVRATRRAKVALGRHLTPAQRQRWRDWQNILVTGSKGGNYCISIDGTVQRLDDNHQFCLAVLENMPLEDIVLAKKLLIESNEPLFLKTANDLSVTNRRLLQTDNERAREQMRRMREMLPQRQPRETPLLQRYYDAVRRRFL